MHGSYLIVNYGQRVPVDGWRMVSKEGHVLRHIATRSLCLFIQMDTIHNNQLGNG